MLKNEFLSLNRELVEYLTRSWKELNGVSFTNYSRKSFRRSNLDQSTYSSLKEAFEDFQWDEKCFLDSTLELISFREKLNRAVESKDSSEVFIQACSVLSWGGVLTNSITSKLLDKHQQNSLLDYMTWIVVEKPFDATSTDTNIFEKRYPETILSDSGVTKIYAVTGNECVIYDDRVAASLCYLISNYLGKKPLDDKHGLKLVRGQRVTQKNKKGNRDPSSQDHRFLPKGPEPKNRIQHAQSNLKANWLISEVVINLLKTDQAFARLVDEHSHDLKFNNKMWIGMRIYESSLFMAGHTVPLKPLRE